MRRLVVIDSIPTGFADGRDTTSVDVKTAWPTKSAGRTAWLLWLLLILFMQIFILMFEFCGYARVFVSMRICECGFT